jgi:hypothetical protein
MRPTRHSRTAGHASGRPAALVKRCSEAVARPERQRRQRGRGGDDADASADAGLGPDLDRLCCAPEPEASHFRGWPEDRSNTSGSTLHQPVVRRDERHPGSCSGPPASSSSSLGVAAGAATKQRGGVVQVVCWRPDSRASERSGSALLEFDYGVGAYAGTSARGCAAAASHARALRGSRRHRGDARRGPRACFRRSSRRTS